MAEGLAERGAIVGLCARRSRPAGRGARGACRRTRPTSRCVDRRPGRPRRHRPLRRAGGRRARRPRRAGQQRRHPQAALGVGAPARRDRRRAAHQRRVADPPDPGAARRAGRQRGPGRVHRVGGGPAVAAVRGGLRRVEGGHHRVRRGPARSTCGWPAARWASTSCSPACSTPSCSRCPTTTARWPTSRRCRRRPSSSRCWTRSARARSRRSCPTGSPTSPAVKAGDLDGFLAGSVLYTRQRLEAEGLDRPEPAGGRGSVTDGGTHPLDLRSIRATRSTARARCWSPPASCPRAPWSRTSCWTSRTRPTVAAWSPGDPVERRVRGAGACPGPELTMVELRRRRSPAKAASSSATVIEGMRPALLFGESFGAMLACIGHPDYVAALARRGITDLERRADRPVAGRRVRLRRPRRAGASPAASRSCATAPTTTATPGRSRA